MEPLQVYRTNLGETILYSGTPSFKLLDELALGPGDLWHSSLDQGYTNAFEDIIYQTSVYWWFLNDFVGCNQAISWRLNPYHFAVRAQVWEAIGGFDSMYASLDMQGLDFGYYLLRAKGGIPLYVKGLFKSASNTITISANDRYLFYRKHVKLHHSWYMMYRKGITSFYSEFKAYQYAKKNYKPTTSKPIPLRALKPIVGKPTVSLIIPTMKRQAYTQLLLEDHKKQTYPITEVIIVDATPIDERDDRFYRQEDFNFKVHVKWQITKGSCRARNEAINVCSGDYIIFADDDIRIEPDFVENHIRLLQTYQADACNGLDIMAENIHQDLNDLRKRLNQLGVSRWKVGATASFSNANSCVKREWVTKTIGNDINFDGGYGEDSDYCLSMLEQGAVVLYNPYSANLHLKPLQGGYRWWGSEAKIIGKKRKPQPWELDTPVKFIRPVPSPTITYGILKHFKPLQVTEWRVKHFFIYLFKAPKKEILIRLLKYPYKQLQFSKSLSYAKKLLEIGTRYN